MLELCMSGQVLRIFRRSSFAQIMKAFIGRWNENFDDVENNNDDDGADDDGNQGWPYAYICRCASNSKKKNWPKYCDFGLLFSFPEDG